MRVEIITKIGEPPVVIEAGQVVVYDQYDNPVLLGVAYGPDQLFVGHVGDEDFNTTLRNLGIDKTVVCATPKLLFAGKPQ